jgi:hypothetical protein
MPNSWRKVPVLGGTGARHVGEGRPEWQGRRALSSAGTQHGEQEVTLFSIIAHLMHFEIVIVGLDHGFAGQMT